MKQWTINIEEAQKFLNEEYSEDTYLIEPRGYQKMTKERTNEPRFKQNLQ